MALVKSHLAKPLQHHGERGDEGRGVCEPGGAVRRLLRGVNDSASLGAGYALGAGARDVRRRAVQRCTRASPAPARARRTQARTAQRARAAGAAARPARCAGGTGAPAQARAMTEQDVRREESCGGSPQRGASAQAAARAGAACGGPDAAGGRVLPCGVLRRTWWSLGAGILPRPAPCASAARSCDARRGVHLEGRWCAVQRRGRG
jgi:hypothetical protein